MTAVTPENWLKAGKQETDERHLVEAAQRDPRRRTLPARSGVGSHLHFRA